MTPEPAAVVAAQAMLQEFYRRTVDPTWTWESNRSSDRIKLAEAIATYAAAQRQEVVAEGDETMKIVSRTVASMAEEITDLKAQLAVAEVELQFHQRSLGELGKWECGHVCEGTGDEPDQCRICATAAERDASEAAREQARREIERSSWCHYDTHGWYFCSWCGATSGVIRKDVPESEQKPGYPVGYLIPADEPFPHKPDCGYLSILRTLTPGAAAPNA